MPGVVYHCAQCLARGLEGLAPLLEALVRVDLLEAAAARVVRVEARARRELGQAGAQGGDEGLGLEAIEHAEHELEDLLALGGVGAGAELVEDDHRPDGEALEEGADAHQLHAEAAFGLIDARVLDEGHEQARARDETGFGGGDEEPALGEELAEAERLEQARLAARVRAGDEHAGVVAIAVDVAGDGLDAAREEQGVEEADEASGAVARELGQADLEPRLERTIAKAEGSEVELEVAEELDQSGKLGAETASRSRAMTSPSPKR